MRAGDYVDACGDHGGRVNQGADRRGAFHGVREPDVKRELRGFAAGSHEEQQARDGERAENAPALMRPVLGRDFFEKLREVQGLESLEQQKHAKHEAEIADAVDDKGFFARVGGGFSEEVKADEQVTRKADAFPADEEKNIIRG